MKQMTIEKNEKFKGYDGMNSIGCKHNLHLFLSKLLVVCVLVSKAQSPVYTYDNKGRVISDKTNNITLIQWNNANKVSQIVTNQNVIDFLYNGSNERIGKIVKPKSENGSLKSQQYWEYIYYQHDAAGKEVARYERSYNAYGGGRFTDMFSLAENTFDGGRQLSSRSEPLAVTNFTATNDDILFDNVVHTGLLVPPAKSIADSKRGEKQYDLSDHAKNIMATVSDRKKQEHAELIFAQDYYPYGMAHPSRSYDQGEFKFGFAGMETDAQLGGNRHTYNFGARLYDPRIARWWSVDKLYAKTPGVSPYVYSESSPLALTDPDGNETIFTVLPNKDKKGGTVIISTEIILRNNPSATFVTNYQKIVDHYYTPKVWVDYRTGQRWTIKFDITVMDIGTAFRKSYDPVTRTVKKPGYSYAAAAVFTHQDRSNSGSYYVGHDVYTNENFDDYESDDSRMLTHETGHHLGLSDRYVERDPELKEASDRKHTDVTKSQADEPYIKNDLMYGGVFISGTHLDNWLQYAVHPEYGDADLQRSVLPVGAYVDRIDGKLTPYLVIPYVRNRNAYESIKRGEELRQKRQNKETMKAAGK